MLSIHDYEKVHPAFSLADEAPSARAAARESSVDVKFSADPADRLFPSIIESPDSAARRRFALLLAACVVVHLSLIAILLFGGAGEEQALAPEQEIPVEVVAEIPEPKVEPQPPKKLAPPPPDLIEPPIVKPKPPPPKVQLEDVEVARDAPRAGDSAETKKGDPDKETKAPRVAPPPKRAEPEAKKQNPDEAPPASEEAATTPEPQSAPQKLADDKPDAEPLDKAQPQPQTKPLQRQAPAQSKNPSAQGKHKSVADQLAALSPSPSYSFGSSAKSAPVTGGTEKASYESMLLAVIRRHYQAPPMPIGHPITTVGAIGIYIDEMGNLTHQVILRASGRPEVDRAWLAAVHRAAPFPAPPRGIPHGLTLVYPSDGT